MHVYLLMLTSVYLFSTGIRRNSLDGNTFVSKNKNINININNFIYLSIVLIILITVSAIRYYVGTDYSTYKGLFIDYMNKPIIETILSNEGGFWFFACIIGKITNNVNWVFAFYSLFIVFSQVLFIYKNSNNFSLSIFLYITMMIYYSHFNGIRQYFAESIVIWGLNAIREKKVFKYIVICLVASYFHNSAIYMIPLYFIATRKAWSPLIFVLIIGFILLAYFFNDILDSLFSIFNDSTYQHYLVYDQNDDGVNVLRVLVLAVPVFISFLFYNNLSKENKDIDIIINFSLISFLIYFLATKSTVLARVAIYTDIYNILLIPYFVKLFKSKDKTIIQIIIMILFFIYMIMLLPRDSNLLPYRTIFSAL